MVVGREGELAALAEVFGRAAGGRGACVVVSGEAGVGKTRLVTEAAGRARGRGQVVLAGRSTPTDRVSPLRPLGEALLEGLRDRRPPDDPVLAPYLPALGMLVPHWAAGPAFPAVPPAPVVLAEAVLRVARWLSAGRGAVVVLEDMHWADRETLAVLAYLADHVAAFPVAVVLTARSDEPGTSGLGSALTRGALYLHLAPLADSEVAVMAAACLGVDAAPAAILAGLRRNAAGLPLLVEDLVGVAGQPGPVRYAEIISGRLAGLDAGARGVVDAAAVLGTEVDPGLPGQVSGLAPAAAAEAVTAARASGLLTPVDGRLAFRHALVRELVLAQLDPRDRAGLCRRAAQALEASGPGGISERLGELWIQAGEPRRAVTALHRAGRAARAAGAIAAAETLVRRALAVAPPDLAGAARLELLELLAVAGRTGELSAVGEQALDDLAHDLDLTAAVHLLLARAAVGAGVPAEAGQHLDAASGLGVLGPRRSAQVRVVRAAAVIAGGGPERLALSARLAGQAVTAAEDAGDPELSCEALELLATALRPRDLTAAAGVLRRGLAAAERAGLVLWRLRALNELGTVEAMRDARGDRLRRAHELAVRVGALDTAASSLINLAGLYVMTGALPEAIAAAGQARQLAAALGATPAVAAATALEAVAHGFAGRRADMEHGLRRAVELAPDDADIAAWATGGARGVVALLFEERAEALAAFARARALGAPVRAADPWHTALLVLAVQGEVTVAEVEAELARATAGARFPATWLGYAHAVTLAAAGDAAAAEAAFGRAERAAGRYPLFRAIALRLAAEAALDHPFGDPVAWLREAEAAFVSRRLARIAGACRGLLARAGAPATRRRGRDDAALAPDLLRLGVTAREAEILELVGEHLSNKDIAARLYLSPRTVEKHVASLLLKTGTADRATLGRLARPR
ncbi:MAG TPA: AAA family ATPase [Streptosporangiaceae bacterium]|nr:AAA family ATPase [Streptosporangiaceae bacterium]